MNKRGLSKIVMTIILIALVLIAAFIVWATITNVLDEKEGEVVNAPVAQIIKVQKAFIDGTGDLNITFKRLLGPGPLDKIRAVITNGTDEQEVFIDTTIKEGQIRSYVVNLDLDNPKEVFVYPVTSDKNKDYVGVKTDDEKVCLQEEDCSAGDDEEEEPILPGDGTEGNPYKILTCNDLQDVEKDLDANYILWNDINCREADLIVTGSGELPNGRYFIDGSYDGKTTYKKEGEDYWIWWYTQVWAITSSEPGEWPGDGWINTPPLIGAQLGGTGAHVNTVAIVSIGEDGFRPIGDYTNKFAGTFNGNGNVITNLYINRPSEDYVGLFGYTGPGAVIKDVGLEDVDMNGEDFVGGLVGLVDWNSMPTTIQGSYTTGELIGSGGNVGGLIGKFDNSHSFDFPIENCYSKANVEGVQNVGGLVGYLGSSYSIITNSYATGNVVATVSDAGGLVGFTTAGLKIQNSFATGEVVSPSDRGLLVGQSDGHILNCYVYNPPGDSGVCVDGGNPFTEDCTLVQNEEHFFNSTNQPMFDDDEFPPEIWDFDNIWEEKVGDYPILQWQVA